MSILMKVEGVLTNHLGKPIHAGEHLYRVLVNDNRLVLSSNRTYDDLARYTASRSLRDWATLRGSEEVLPGVDLYWRHIEVEKSSGILDFVVTNDPTIIEKCMAASIPALLFVHPTFMVPEYRPDSDSPVRPWDVMVADMERRTVAAGKDDRLKFEDVDLGFE
jgi:hypothetical protein